jgi:GTP-binding protein EngB required for normal cell division
MKLDRFIRLSIGLIVLLVFIIAIAALLFVTESALNVWDRLVQGPRYILYGYIAAIALLVAAAILLAWKLVVRRKVSAPAVQQAPLTQQHIAARLSEAEKAGVDTEAAQSELQQLAERQETGSVHLCFFGEVSTGKSSLIKALIPSADVAINPVGGSTIDIRHYRWKDREGTQILLTDVPGTGGLEEGLDDIAVEEAQRSHLVLYVCDGDLTRAEGQAVEWLMALGKPLILVMNKSDRYSLGEQALLIERLLDHVDGLGEVEFQGQVVAVSAGGEMEVIERAPDGKETAVKRQRPADIGVLVVAINRLLEGGSKLLDVKRDRAVFRLAADKLAEAEIEYREQRAAQIIRSSTRKAVVGALAAVSPGTDIVVQGYIGTAMTRELCHLYGAKPRDLDVEEFLTLSQSRAGKTLPLTMAVAGNGLKAFPGVGTVAGGLAHAVAYGLIFDALGRSLVMTLKTQGEFDPGTAAAAFEDGISEHIEAGVRQVARMALDQKDTRDRS